MKKLKLISLAIATVTLPASSILVYTIGTLEYSNRKGEKIPLCGTDSF